MAGKGPNWREGTNFGKYYDSPYWESRRKELEKVKEHQLDPAELVKSVEEVRDSVTKKKNNEN